MTHRSIRTGCFAACLVAAASTQANAQGTSRISVDSAGTEANHISYTCSVSADGSVVAFASWANNLVGLDTNGVDDVFVRDRLSGSTFRVSVDSAGVQATGLSWRPFLSANGRFVAFESEANNLVPGDSNYSWDVFVHDLQTGQTTRASVDSMGVEGNSASYDPFISATGRYVVFPSFSNNLVLGDTNGKRDVFVHDRQTGQTSRASVDSAGVEANGHSFATSISADGRYVAFDSEASNLVAGDTNNTWDVFLHDRQTGQTTRVSVDSLGTEGNAVSGVPFLSEDGRFVSFESTATNLVPGDLNGRQDVFVHEVQTGQTSLASIDSAGVQGNGWSSASSMSADGRFVAFGSDSSNLVPADFNGVSDVFVHDQLTGKTVRSSLTSSGVEGGSYSYLPAISADGRFVAFESEATNLVPGDTNGRGDIFFRGGPLLAVTGSCPGPMSISVAGATPGGPVVVVWGTAGSFVIPNGFPCATTQLDLLPLFNPPPGYRLVQANAQGQASTNGSIPPNACGWLVQALDLPSWNKSNTGSL